MVLIHGTMCFSDWLLVGLGHEEFYSPLAISVRSPAQLIGLGFICDDVDLSGLRSMVRLILKP